MTDGGAAFQPGTTEMTVPFRSRAGYAGYRAFGSGDGAVLVEPEVTRRLRSAAELATREGRVTGGLLYGHGGADEQGGYLVIDGYLEAGPGEGGDDRVPGGLTLSAAGLRPLRADGARMYPGAVEAGWWRTLPALGEFGPADLATQAELAGPDGAGLLVYGSGAHWGTAYLGPDGHAPDTAGTLVAAPEAVAGPRPAEGTPGAPPQAGAGAGPEPEVVDIAAGESLATPGPPDRGTTAGRRRQRRGRVRGRTADPARTAVRRWAIRRASLDAPGPETPGDVQLVVAALLAATAAAAAVIVGVLASSVLVAVIIAAIGFLAILGTVWMSHR